MTRMSSEFEGGLACFSRVSRLAWEFIPRRQGWLHGWRGGCRLWAKPHSSELMPAEAGSMN